MKRARLPSIAEVIEPAGLARVQLRRFVGQRLARGHGRLALGPHGHRFFELVFIESGRGTHRVGSALFPVRGGDLFVLGPGDVHDFTGMARTRGWLVMFHADAVDAQLTDADAFRSLPGELLMLSFLRPRGFEHGHFRLTAKQQAIWLRHLKGLEEELHTQALGFERAATAHLHLLLVECARLAAPRLGQMDTASLPVLGEVFAFIEANHRRPISLADVAKAVGRSSGHLTTLVRARTGRTVLEWIIERRMTEARRLLLETDHSVEQISEALSYLDTGYFIRQFRKLHGTTPRAWRQRQRGAAES